MQKTSFPFRAVVHDDCSTDRSAAIIREYAEKYPDIIEPIYETENQWKKGTLTAVMDAATMNRSDYIAYCEGDDYWIDPHKLQKQVDYMDAHPECTMVCTNARIEAPKGILTEEDLKNMGWYHYNESRIMATEDIITKGGWFIHTCTTLYRANIKDSYPEECQRCHVGDYPLQIFAALNGQVYYIHEKTSVYRYCSNGSWTANNKKKLTTSAIPRWESSVRMLDTLNKYSKKKYDKIFKQTTQQAVLKYLKTNPHLLEATLERMGYVFINNYTNSHSIADVDGLSKKLHLILTKIRWYPFEPSPIINLLKNKSITERLRLGRMCKKSLKNIH